VNTRSLINSAELLLWNFVFNLNVKLV